MRVTKPAPPPPKYLKKIENKKRPRQFREQTEPFDQEDMILAEGSL